MININWKQYIRDHLNLFGIHYIKNPWMTPGHTWAISSNKRGKTVRAPSDIKFKIVRALEKWV